MAGKYVFLPGIPLDAAPRRDAQASGVLRGTVPLSEPGPTEGDEGWDPHEEHREYERLKAEYEAAKRELERLQAAAKAPKSVTGAPAAPAPAQTAARRNWREIIVGAEILGRPKSRRR